MTDFEEVLDNLNPEQLRAVKTIDGPLLVLAGPGTGKTQLLSARVAYILRETDTAASNILCLTFTENGAANMRDRLRSFIGDEAYDVTISTYHSFGSDIIKNYSEHFQQIATDRTDDIRMERPIDELTQIQIMESIIAKLPFDSPLLSARYYVKNVLGTISDLKQNLIDPNQLRQIAQDNLAQIDAAQPILDEVVNNAGGISRKKAEWPGQYSALLEALSNQEGTLVEQAAKELAEAYQNYTEIDSSKPLTIWKNNWLKKDGQDNFTLTDRSSSEKMIELAKIYVRYEAELAARAAYDFDDMILRAIKGITENDELRFNLQERYQYILLDEFQDTNPSQFELVKRIADHPVHEGRPYIMAVGDDDQAIFAFQGANVGNMKDFLTTFREVEVINLVENYRSHADIIHTFTGVAEQITDRIHHQLEGIEKSLVASSKKLPPEADIQRRNFSAEASEYSWVAKKIDELIQSGTDPSHIAVLSPRHKLLEGLVPFLHNKDIPITYEKRENILQTEIVTGLRLAAQLLQALASNDLALANQYFPQVLSLPYWQIPAIEIWRINWQLAKYEENRSWAEIALETPSLELPVRFYLKLAATAATEPLEITLDKLAGTLMVEDADQQITAPLKAYYFDAEKRAADALKYYEAISHLSVIRSHLRDHQAGRDQLLSLDDFLNFFIMYEAAEAPLTNSHPIAQATKSVQLMTAYGSKGLEFDHVFILQAHDDVWGKSSGGSNKLSLPQNLSYIRYSGSSDDERLRLFFVAVSRAKHGLYITSHSTRDNGKPNTPLKYLGESTDQDDITTSAYLPANYQAVLQDETHPEQLAGDIETLWQAGQINLPADFKALLADQIRAYRMSPTHLNSFLDMEFGGPENFLVGTLLRFPAAPGASGEFGTAIHNTLEWYQNQLNEGKTPGIDQVLGYYDKELGRRYLSQADRDHARGKGRLALQKYISSRADMFKLSAKAEVNFRGEGVTIEPAVMSGKIDRLEVDEDSKTLHIVDYKTGSPITKWGGSDNLKGYKYRQQLYLYKLLLENSNTWKGYTVASARLEFVEPLEKGLGDIAPPLYIEFDPNEEANLKKLIAIVWQHIQDLDLPDTSTYSNDLKGTKQFEQDLLNGKV